MRTEIELNVERYAFYIQFQVHVSVELQRHFISVINSSIPVIVFFIEATFISYLAGSIHRHELLKLVSVTTMLVNFYPIFNTFTNFPKLYTYTRHKVDKDTSRL